MNDRKQHETIAPVAGPAHGGVVKVGDVWLDRDPRSDGRTLTVHFVSSTHASCKSGGKIGDALSARMTQVAIRRLLKASKYSLVSRG